MPKDSYRWVAPKTNIMKILNDMGVNYHLLHPIKIFSFIVARLKNIVTMCLGSQEFA